MPLREGDRIDRFTIEALLGRGGMGVVYRALDPRLGRRVAIKLLEGLAADSPARARFDREARLIASLDHPAAVHVYEAGESDGTPYIVMELVDGVTLRVAAATEASWRVKLGWLVEAAAALAAAHDAGLVHRDVKPDNIMVRTDGRVKVLDFGIARRVRVAGVAASTTHGEGVTAEGTIVGTPRYMAPEQLRGEPLDGRADQFAWGVTAFEVLSGESPWGDTDDGVSLISRILGSPAPPVIPRVPGLPAAAGEVLMRTLAKERSTRFGTMREVVEALWAVLGGRPAPVSRGVGALASAPTEEAPVQITPPRFTPEAIAPTEALSGPPPVATGPTLAPAPRRSWGVAAAIGLVVVAGVGAWAAKRAHATAAPQATIGSASGSASAAPAPVSSNAEAARLYAEGWETWRTDSNVEGIGAWQRAVKLDPELCPAQLRLALYALGLPDRTGPVAFEAARRCAPKLSERDRALLEVAAPLFAPRWDQSAFAATAAKIALAFPDDPEVQYARAEGLASSDPAAAVTAYDRVIQLDPKFVHAYVGKQAALARLGKTEEAERALRDCLAASPGAVFCAFAERHILLETGRCADTESVARAFIQDRPSNPAGYGWLADALLGRGAPQEAVEAALEQARERYGPEALGEYTTRFVFMESTKEFYGDFAAALALMDQRAEAGAKQYTVAQQAIAVVQRARVLQEIGRTDEARSVMRSFLRRSDGYAFTTEADKVAAVAAGVSLGIEPLSALVDLVNRAPDYLPKDPTPAQRWGGTYVWDDPSPAFAREAVAKIPRGDDLQGVRTLVSPEVIPLVLRQVGTTLARGGRPDLAVPWLREGLKGCVQIVELELAPSQALSRFHAELELGKALEAQGDKAGAREQYQSILRYWGDAKPRSVTADEARRRLATLGP